MASHLARRLIRRPVSAFFLARSYGHTRQISHYILPGDSVCTKPLREVLEFFPRSSHYKWAIICTFSFVEGDLVDAVVPFMGESVTDGTLATFLKKPVDRVEVDEPIAQIETDKVTIDVASPEAGFIQKFTAKEGDTVTPGTKVLTLM